MWNAAPEDGDEPHPCPAGGVDIRVPIPDVDGVIPPHWYRREDGVEGFGVRLGVSALPRAGRRKPPRVQTRGMQTIVECLEIIRGAQRYGDMVPAEPVDGLKGPLDRRVGVRALDGTKVFFRIGDSRSG